LSTQSVMDLYAYCMELQSYHTLLLAIIYLCQTHHIQQAAITMISCNSQGTICQVSALSTIVLIMTRHIDLLQAIHVTWWQFPVNKIHFWYISGPPWLEDLLLLLPQSSCGYLAKSPASCAGIPSSSTTSWPLPGLEWSLSINALPFSSDLQKVILDCLSFTRALSSCNTGAHCLKATVPTMS